VRREILATALGTLLLTQPAPAQDGTPRDAGAAIDRHAFRYARPITAAEPGLTTITLDAAALAHSSLNDLRIATAEGRQVPYVLERLDTSFSLALAPPELVTSTGEPASSSTYRVRLPYSGLPASRLVMHTTARVFTRVLRLEMPSSDDDARARNGPVVLAMTSWRNDDPDRAAAALEMDVPALHRGELRLVVDEGDNAPLPLRDASLSLPTYRLRFYYAGHTPLTLLYGQPALGAPRYDLALLAPRLSGAAAQEAELGPELDGSHVTGITPTIVFWCALGVAVLALVVLIARLLRPNGSPPAAAAASSTTPTTSATPATGE
jgi:hypothetical protein